MDSFAKAAPQHKRWGREDGDPSADEGECVTTLAVARTDRMSAEPLKRVFDRSGRLRPAVRN